MRLFIALPLPELITNKLQEYSSYYNLPEVRLIPMQNLHVTVFFIGEFPEEKYNQLNESLGQIAPGLEPFTLKLKEIAPGPKLKSPRLVWARFQEHPAFKKLVLSVSEMLQVKPDHAEFIPHITFARFKKNANKPANLPVLTPSDFSDLQVRTLAIWESKLQSPHPEYRILAEFRLGKE